MTSTATWYPLTPLEFLAHWVDHVPERWIRLPSFAIGRLAEYAY